MRVNDGSRRTDTLLSDYWPRAPHMPTTCHLLKPESRRALELLAPCRDGCTETTMLAHGFSIDMMVELINSGLATLQTEWFLDDGYQGERARVRIAEAGRRAH